MRYTTEYQSDQRLERPVLFSVPLTQYGLVWEWGVPAAPKCFLASLSLLALRRRVLVPDHRLLLKFRIDDGKVKTTDSNEWTYQ